MSRVLLAALVLTGLSVPAFAQNSVRHANLAASAAAAADWVTTYRALAQQPWNIREKNPLLRPWQGEPSRLVALGAAMDAGGLVAWNLAMRRHPRVATVGLWAMSGVRAYWAIRNARNLAIAKRVDMR